MVSKSIFVQRNYKDALDVIKREIKIRGKISVFDVIKMDSLEMRREKA